jgi:hypothetical protein
VSLDGRRRLWRFVVAAALFVVVATVVGVAVARDRGPGDRPLQVRPPAADGYFRTVPPGHWRRLPGDGECAGRVHRSAWEPRADNDRPNHRMPSIRAVRRSLSERPRGVRGAYHEAWDRWLLPRITGHYTGTTDEILQWAACKWGIDDNLLRAIAVRESGWYQYEVYRDGRCVVQSGCGDAFGRATPATRTFCSRVVAAMPGHPGYARGRCPKTFSIVGVMAWQDPHWGPMRDNQNGTFPFSLRSTAFAIDYLASMLRGCYEGWMTWLRNTGPYHAGNLRGCVGAWYGGAWLSKEARAYTHRVWHVERARPWLRPRWAAKELPCSPLRGCPQAPS